MPHISATGRTRRQLGDCPIDPVKVKRDNKCHPIVVDAVACRQRNDDAFKDSQLNGQTAMCEHQLGKDFDTSTAMAETTV